MPFGGSEELWYKTALHLKGSSPHNIGVSIRNWTPEPGHVSELRKKNCQISLRTYTSDMKGIQKKLNALLPYRFRSKPNQKHIAWLDSFRPDLAVISQGGNTEGAEWMQACIDKNIPFINLIHLASEKRWPKDKQASQLAKLYSHSQKCYFVSEGNVRLTEKQLAHKFSNAGIARNPFKVPYDIDVKWPENNEVIRLASLARLGAYHKGQDILLEVMAMDKWKQRKLEVSIYGSGPNEVAFKRLKDLWDIQNVHFKGFVDDVGQVWKTHHGLIMPSRSEGLPLALVEAMLARRVPVVTDVGGNKEVVDDNSTGFIAKAATAALLDEALERFWQQRHQLESIGIAAGVEIRKKIPADPVQVFAQQVLRHL